MPKMDNSALSKPSMPYHARSSTINPVTRQGSAFHSMADTSDNYSSFSELSEKADPKKIERR